VDLAGQGLRDREGGGQRTGHADRISRERCIARDDDRAASIQSYLRPGFETHAPQHDDLTGGLVEEELFVLGNIPRQPALAAEFGVRAIPTFIVIRDREVVKQHPGLAMPGTIKRWLATR